MNRRGWRSAEGSHLSSGNLRGDNHTDPIPIPIVVRRLGQALDSKGNIIKKTFIKFPATLANKMETLHEETLDEAETPGFEEQCSHDPITVNGTLAGIVDSEKDDTEVGAATITQGTGETKDRGRATIFEDELSPSCEADPDITLNSPVEVLDRLAKEHGAVLDYKVVEMDSGDMNMPLYYECTLQAGTMIVKTESPVKQIAKLLAAQECLSNMKMQYPGTNIIPDWKHVKPLNRNLDPVFLLMHFCKSYQLILPCYSYSTYKFPNGERGHFYKCFWNQTCTEGRGHTKELAQRLAAFEMLDYLIKNNKSDISATPMDYRSINGSSVQAVLTGHLKQEHLAHATAPFEVIRQTPAQSNEPEIRVRHGLATKGYENLKYLRYTSEYEATFRCTGDTSEEAFQKCVASAKRHAEKLQELVKEALGNKTKR